MYAPLWAVAISLRKRQKKSPIIFISIALWFSLLNGVVGFFFFHTLIQVGLSRSSCPSKKSLPKHRVWVLCCKALYSSQSTLWPLKCVLLRVGGCIFNYLRWFSFPLVKLLMSLLAHHLGETAQLMISPRIYYLIMESAGLRNSYHLSNGLVWLIKEVFLAHRRYQYI